MQRGDDLPRPGTGGSSEFVSRPTTGASAYSTAQDESGWKTKLALAKSSKGFLDFLAYIILLALFTVVALRSHPGQDLLLHNTALRNAVSDQEIFFGKSQVKKVYSDIDSVDEFWDWLSGPFVGTVLAEDFPNRPGFFYPYFRILGLIRLRQLRVGRDTCFIPVELASSISSCFAPYSKESEETEPFGPTSPETGRPIWQWYSAEELNEGNYVGRAGTKYAGSGFNVTIELDKEKALQELQVLRDNNWIDVQTRAVFVDFLVYNPNLNFLTLVKLATEFPATSGLKKFVLLRTAPVHFLLMSEAGSSTLIEECLILVTVLILLAVEVSRMRSQGFAYFGNGWHYLDWLNYLSFIAAFTLRLLPLQAVGSSGFPPGPTEFINYETPMWAIVQWKNVIALNSVLTWLRLFKYAKSVPFMAFLIKTLAKAAGQTVAFCSMLLVVYVGFSLGHHVAFGADLVAFRDLLNTLFALYRVLLTADYFDDMYESNRVLGPFLFFAWTLIGYFIMLHMFIAILNEAIVHVTITQPMTTVTETIEKAVKASQSAVTAALQHRSSSLALQRLNRRYNALPVGPLRTPAQKLLADTLERSRAKLEAEASASADEVAVSGDAIGKESGRPQDAKALQRLEALEISLSKVVIALRGHLHHTDHHRDKGGKGHSRDHRLDSPSGKVH